MANGGPTFSVIGADVTVRGDIEANADLHVDGVVEGDMVCAALVQGEGSRIEGSIRADSARLSGTVRGTIQARELVILKSARIDGDVHYEALTIEQGATVQGRFTPDGEAPVAEQGSAGTAAKPDSEDEQRRLSLAG